MQGAHSTLEEPDHREFAQQWIPRENHRNVDVGTSLHHQHAPVLHPILLDRRTGGYHGHNGEAGREALEFCPDVPYLDGGAYRFPYYSHSDSRIIPI